MTAIPLRLLVLMAEGLAFWCYCSGGKAYAVQQVQQQRLRHHRPLWHNESSRNVQFAGAKYEFKKFGRQPVTALRSGAAQVTAPV